MPGFELVPYNDIPSLEVKCMPSLTIHQYRINDIDNDVFLRIDGLVDGAYLEDNDNLEGYLENNLLFSGLAVHHKFPR